jgi:hypothetical protein
MGKHLIFMVASVTTSLYSLRSLPPSPSHSCHHLLGYSTFLEDPGKLANENFPTPHAENFLFSPGTPTVYDLQRTTQNSKLLSLLVQV